MSVEMIRQPKGRLLLVMMTPVCFLISVGGSYMYWQLSSYSFDVGSQVKLHIYIICQLIGNSTWGGYTPGICVSLLTNYLYPMVYWAIVGYATSYWPLHLIVRGAMWPIEKHHTFLKIGKLTIPCLANITGSTPGIVNYMMLITWFCHWGSQ